MDRPVNILIINVKLALGPLMIRKKLILINTVIIDNIPKIFLIQDLKPPAHPKGLFNLTYK